MNKGARRMAAVSTSVLCAAGVVAYVWLTSVRPPIFELYVFDTPGMPSAFIRTAEDRRILINGGANSDIVHRLTELLPFYSRRIDEIVAVNDDSKNVTGLIEVLNRYQVGATSIMLPTSSDPVYGVLLKNQKVSNVSTGLQIFDAGDARVNVVDSKKNILLLAAGSERALIIPFNLNNLTKKLLAATKPDYLIYSAQIEKNPHASAKQGTSKGVSGLLAGILMDHRFNIRESGGVRLTIENGRIDVRPLRSE